MYSFFYLEPVCCSMSSSNCCFLTCIQVSQEAGQVVWYSHLFQNFPQFIVILTVKGFGIVNKAEMLTLIINTNNDQYSSAQEGEDTPPALVITEHEEMWFKSARVSMPPGSLPSLPCTLISQGKLGLPSCGPHFL